MSSFACIQNYKETQFEQWKGFLAGLILNI